MDQAPKGRVYKQRLDQFSRIVTPEATRSRYFKTFSAIAARVLNAREDRLLVKVNCARSALVVAAATKSGRATSYLFVKADLARARRWGGSCSV